MFSTVSNKFKDNQFALLFYALTIYLIYNTGIHSDDYIMSLGGSTDIKYLAATPGLYIFRSVFYDLIPDHLIIFECVKIISILFSLYMIAKFFSYFHPSNTSILIAFIIIFFPSHEATTYFFTGQYYIWTIALLMYSCWHALNKNYKNSVIFSALGSFLSYGSTPYAIGLGFLCYIKKEKQGALALLAPNVIYIVYYIITTKMIGVGVSHINIINDYPSYFKQLILQFGGAIDSIIGPSFWLKISYSIGEITLFSLIIGIIALVIVFMRYTHTLAKPNVKLLLSFGIIFLLSIAMYTATGKYPQIAFNLGDRVTLYTSLIVTYLLITLPNIKTTKFLIMPCLIISILGLSNHWKLWNSHQNSIIANIHKNEEIKHIPDSETLFVSGNQYSKLGQLDHIEFFSESFVVGAIFHLALGKDTKFKLRTLNSRMKYENGEIIDPKYKSSELINTNIYIYNSVENKILIIDKSNINSYLQSLPENKRHWIQLVDNGFIMKSILYLMPRLEYAFKNR